MNIDYIQNKTVTWRPPVFVSFRSDAAMEQSLAHVHNSAAESRSYSELNIERVKLFLTKNSFSYVVHLLVGDNTCGRVTRPLKFLKLYFVGLSLCLDSFLVIYLTFT